MLKLGAAQITSR